MYIERETHEDVMKIIHTSPEKIENINNKGIFGDCLFFSSEEYTMTQSETVYVYSLEISEEQICHVSDLYDEEIVAHIANVLSISHEEAENVLTGRNTAWDYGGDGEDDWWVQGKQGECAKKMGFESAESIDEQGTVYIVSMTGRECDLVLVRVV